jgi:hypothetical protein
MSPRLRSVLELLAVFAAIAASLGLIWMVVSP